ncbi:hypothetical protein NECAME_03502 [Necator americanus]|nr:hypothetical protein NECAME_03502 [Necator americanus]ETN76339.1 hypothetical protein NECAME_03502 [Necator americanus]
MKGRIQEVEGSENTTDEGCTSHLITEAGDSESENESSLNVSPSTSKLRIEELNDQKGNVEDMDCSW